MTGWWTLFGALVLALATALATNEVKAWLPTLAAWIARRGAMRFRDPAMRLRYAEEWPATLKEIPGPWLPSFTL